MNRFVKYFAAVILIGLGPMSPDMDGQSRYDTAYTEIAKRFPENVVVFTDRTLYAVNEVIQFTALLQSEEKPYRGPGSSVLYIELVDPAGNGIVKSKYPIEDNHSSGQLPIPSNLTTGMYYLRCYTRWMRNFGASSFSYVPLRIVNPFSRILQEDHSGTENSRLIAVPEGENGIEVTPARTVYGMQETADVEFSLKGGMEGEVQHACLTIVPVGAADSSICTYRVEATSHPHSSFQFNFLPEPEGVTLSGVVYEQNSTVPVSGIGLHFTLLGAKPGYFVTQSDQHGRFQVKTPHRIGTQELLVIPEMQSGAEVDVQVDNDFAADPLPFYPATLDLSGRELETASRVSLNMQLQRAFLADLAPEQGTDLTATETIPFYGNPEFTLRVDDFINLPTLEEIVENLIPRTYVIRRGNEVNFSIKGDHPMLSLFPPLLLIDYVPVFDAEAFLSIPPSKIDRIDVVPEAYVLGDMKFGGIISLTSIQGDLASIQLPAGSYFFDYTGFQPALIQKDPVYTDGGKIPDTRNTLLWKEHFTLYQDSRYRESFRTSSLPGTYLILIRGVLSDGTPVWGSSHFKVE